MTADLSMRGGKEAAADAEGTRQGGGGGKEAADAEGTRGMKKGSRTAV
jgi:hypothetical protein